MGKLSTHVENGVGRMMEAEDFSWFNFNLVLKNYWFETDCWTFVFTFIQHLPLPRIRDQKSTLDFTWLSASLEKFFNKIFEVFDF